MKQSRFTDSDIVHILQLADNGESIASLCDRYQLSIPAFYKWRAKYRGLDATNVQRVRQLEIENKVLQKRLSEERHKLSLLQKIICEHVAKPALRSQIAAEIVEDGKVSIRAACQLLEISETCYRYHQNTHESV
jgi:putative transposase